jgi:hypothetical protein
MFGLEAVEHDDDFASVLQNGPWLWQSNSFTTGYSGFFQFCDAVENVTAGQANPPDANGVGLQTALAGYASLTTANPTATATHTTSAVSTLTTPRTLSSLT